MLVIYGILLTILLGAWAWTRRTAWIFPVAIVAILFIATWLNFRWEVAAWLIFAVIIIALAILFAKVILGVILGFVALLIAVAIGLGAVIPDFTAAPPNASIGTPATSAPASPPATAPTCEAKFVQVKADYGPDNRVDGTFEKAYADTVSNKTGAEKEAAMRDLILKHSANNGQRLAIWAHANGLYANPNDWQKLVAGDCLSKEGQDLWNKLDGALSAAGTQFSEGNAPQDGHNSGTLPDGTYSVADRPGISSDTKSIVITHKDGSKVYILVYCGNVVFLTPPAGVPTSPEIPGPPQTCPEGMSGVPPNCDIPPPVIDCIATPTLPECLTPKTNGIWIQPTPGGDGTTDSEGQWQQYGPGEFTGPTPPKVITQQPGASSGGTVIDSPAKAPSSETGGQAPGATTEPKPSKPAETGANDPGVQNPDQPAVGGNDGHIDNPFG